MLKATEQLCRSVLKNSDLRQYLIQQGFFQNELTLPSEPSAERDTLFACARNYLREKQSAEAGPLLYLEAITYCLLHRSFNNLDEPQRKAITHFIEIIASES